MAMRVSVLCSVMRNVPLYRIQCWSVRSVVLAAMLAALPEHASAQSLFDALFGSPKPSPRLVGPSHLVSPASRTFRIPDTLSSRPAYSPATNSEVNPGSGGRTYRTMCVRLCDGYYFPISFRTRPGYLHRDADACNERCGSAGRLFYYPSSSTDMRRAVDQSGLAYASLKTAFLYRKKYDASCTCRPHPWAASEKERHRKYAEGKQARPASSTDVASLDPDLSGSETANAPDVEPPQEPVGDQATAPIPRPSGIQREPGTFARSVSATPRGTAVRPHPRTVLVRSAAPFVSSDRRAPARPRRPVPSNKSPGGSWFSSGPPKYVWPGDPAPVRRR